MWAGFHLPKHVLVVDLFKRGNERVTGISLIFDFKEAVLCELANV